MKNRIDRIKIGRIEIDVVTFAEALATAEELVEARRGGMIFTPNVDHIVNAERDVAFRSAYQAAKLVLVDGQPVVWASQLLGTPLPEKISGSDFVLPLLQRAAACGWRVYLFGARPGVADDVAAWLRETNHVNVVGAAAPAIDIDNRVENQRIAATIQETRPDLVLVALGSPKQELFIHQIAQSMNSVVFLGVGASLDFMAGSVKRAPAWMSRAGLEWLHRLVHEPRRLWRRYLVDDLQFLNILYRDLTSRPKID